MSAKGYAKVFEMGASWMYRRCVAARGAVPAPVDEITEDGFGALLNLRASITQDPTLASSHKILKSPAHAQVARDVGEAHVLASLILGFVGGDEPDFSIPAKVFGDALADHDASMAGILNELEKMFEDLEDTSDEAPDNEQ